MLTITVPPVPEGCTGWRKKVTGTDPWQRGGYAVLGSKVEAGRELHVPVGTVILAYDKTVTGQTTAWRGSRTYEVWSTTVTVLVADNRAEGGLSEVWKPRTGRHQSAFSDSFLGRLKAVLDQVATCRWCQGQVVSNGTLVGRGSKIVAEHTTECPPKRATDGDTCVDCGKTVVSAQAERRLVRKDGGRWETRHREDCLARPVRSKEEQDAEWTAHLAAQKEAARKAAEEKERRRRKAAERRAAKEQEEREAHDLEQARVANLATISRVSEELYNKGIGGGTRARLCEHTDTLEDGTTTTRWTVEIYGGSSGRGGEVDDPDLDTIEEFTRLPTARGTYQQYKFDPSRGTQHHRTRPRTAVDTCPGENTKHCDECGTTSSPGGWMAASLGLACSNGDCYDAMSDRTGRHARRHHR
ncbi:hypothetical protein [Streptomyces qinglanensis]|uniref:hypothetical protein n=1 Tax=Streptomyces qinglanensis TaxID=943816 RepID=UPI003D707F2E